MPLKGKRELVAKLRENSDKLVRALALEMTRRLMMKTPVDTGRARANWNVAIGNYDPTNDEDLTIADVQAQLARGQAVIMQAKAGDAVFTTNSLPYIPMLERGHSRQAPHGMIAVTAQELQPLAQRIAGRIAAGGE